LSHPAIMGQDIDRSSVPDYPLQLATTIVEQSTCKDGGFRLIVRLRYTNTGPQRIILYKHNDFVRVTVSKSEEAAAEGKYEYERRRDLYDFIGDDPGGPSPGKQFVILDPGKSYETGTDFSQEPVYIYKRLSRGRHVLRVEVSTWDAPQVLGEELSKGWRKYGALWRKPLTSLPMPFTIEKNAKVIPCEGF
jgi:hypothetical protein